jgi:RNase P subunit RPR2
MKGHQCKKCNTELEYEQVCGIRVKREDETGKALYTAYCPKCKKYFRTGK